MSMTRSNNQHGMTLIELMVVVTIVGILMAVAAVTTRRSLDTKDLAHKIAYQVQEGARKAIAGGPLPLAKVGVFGTTARTRTRIFTDASGEQVAILERVNEATDSWDNLGFIALSTHEVTVVGFNNSPESQPGMGPTTPLGPGDEVAVQCYPDGRCDPMTLYLQGAQGRSREARLVVLPLSGNTIVFETW